VRSRHATGGRVIIDGITHRVYGVNSAGVGGTSCGVTFMQRPKVAKRNMLVFGQRTNHEAAVNCMACIAERTGEPTGQRPRPPPSRWPKDRTPWWLVSDKGARRLR
jgi:hypothetical protein